MGGLYVIGTNRHESLRIDDQLRGRSGRQGDPGSSRFYVSLDDDIIKKYGLQNVLNPFLKKTRSDNSMDNPIVGREVARAQRIIEGQNFEIRKTLWNYSSLIEKQRLMMYNHRLDILKSDSPLDYLKNNAPGFYKKFTSVLDTSQLHHLEKQIQFIQIDRCWADHLSLIQDLRESIHLVSIGGKTPLDEFMRQATSAYLGLQNRIKKEILRFFYKLSLDLDHIDFDSEALKGPSSTWTYLINDEQIGWGLEMLKTKNIGFAAGAAAMWGPIYLLLGIYHRYFKRKDI